MGKQDLLNLLNRTEEIKKLLVPRGGDFMPGVKTISRSVDFQTWKADLKQQLLKLKPDPFITEILELVDNGFRNGLTDEKDFTNLQGKLSALSMHIDDYFDVTAEDVIAVGDNLNDMAMIEAFYSYAMSHGNQQLKQAATHVTDSVTHLILQELEGTKGETER